ncbi:MAG: hypothetical protein WBC88_01615, partial [Candidatus Zixiibacteriota bacterium]
MNKKRERFLTGLVILALVAAAATMAYAADIKTHVREVGVRSGAGAATKDVVYDNGMDYVGIGASQDDHSINLDPIIADDFIFDVLQPVNDVHWIGGYWNGPPDDGDFDWEIKFYNDIGDGTKPGAAFATYTFANADVNETFIEEIASSFYFSYSVNLPVPGMTFSPGTKYCISIQGLGDYPPQSGWAVHQDPILQHEAVLKSVYFGYPDWTNTSTVFGYAADMCFQLTYEE